jgi:hypothetical protein
VNVTDITESHLMKLSLTKQISARETHMAPLCFCYSSNYTKITIKCISQQLNATGIKLFFSCLLRTTVLCTVCIRELSFSETCDEITIQGFLLFVEQKWDSGRVVASDWWSYRSDNIKE